VYTCQQPRTAPHFRKDKTRKGLRSLWASIELTEKLTSCWAFPPDLWAGGYLAEAVSVARSIAGQPGAAVRGFRGTLGERNIHREGHE
jgi:hypothetical protein